MIHFIGDAANQSPDLQRRQAFSTVSIDIFAQPEESDKEYLGRVSQGFFAFHALGMFGEAAVKRLSQARETVWMIDSSAQIPALAIASPTHAVFKDCFCRLRDMGIRLFSTEKLFDETFDHYSFANDVVRRNGSFSSKFAFCCDRTTSLQEGKPVP